MSFAEMILGAHVDRICFGVSHFQLGLTKEDHSFTMTSAADIVLNYGVADFRDVVAPTGLTSMVGKQVATTDLDKAPTSVCVCLRNGPSFTAVWPDKIYDSLFTVRIDGTEDWGVIG